MLQQHSYTSNSNRCKPHVKFQMGLQTVMLLLGFVLAFLALQWICGRFDVYARPPVDQSSYIPSSHGPWYLAYAGEDLDHSILYHNVNGVIRDARKADIILLGNSRSLFAYHDEVLRKFSERSGFKVFNMSFGHAESEVFPLAIINKYNIRPKIVVADINLFFNSDSTCARETVQLSQLDAFKRVFESTWSWRLKTLFQHYFIHLTLTSPPIVKKPAYRSYERGSYYLHPLSGGEVPACDWDVAPGVVRAVEEKPLQRMKSFIQETEGRQALVIFTVTLCPGYEDSIARAKCYAQILNKPIIVIPMSRPLTFDGSHATESTAEQFSALFFRELCGYLAASVLPVKEKGR